jgi:hypothetical protein
MLSVVTSPIMLIVVMLSVVAPLKSLKLMEKSLDCERLSAKNALAYCENDIFLHIMTVTNTLPYV